VLRVFPDEGKVLVEHVMMVKKHVRPNPQRNIKGGIAEQERAIPSVECGPGVRDVRSGADRARSARRAQGESLQEVRDDAGQVAAIGFGNCNWQLNACDN
jgi:large subunit ribosomal protein L24